MCDSKYFAGSKTGVTGSVRELGNHICNRFRACSSVGQSSGFLIRGSRVRITPGAPVLLCGAFSLSLLILVAGCASPQPRPVPAPLSSQNAIALFGPAPAKITIVRLEEKFVVIDFSSRTMPALGTKLTVYRAGQKVGVVQLNGPTRARAAVADILDGEISTGDEVR